MSSKQETLALLEQLPDDAPAWEQLREEVRLLRGIARAEDDVRAGRLVSLDEAGQRMQQKWQQAATPSK